MRCQSVGLEKWSLGAWREAHFLPASSQKCSIHPVFVSRLLAVAHRINQLIGWGHHVNTAKISPILGGLVSPKIKIGRKSGTDREKRLRNTPPVVNPGVRLFAELFGDPAWNATRLGMIAIVQACVIFMLGLAIYQMLPLKKVVPYIVELTPDGVVARIAQASAYKPEANFVKAEIGRWAKQMLVLDPYLTRENLRATAIPLRGKAIQQHSEFLAKEAPFKRLAENPGLVREVEVKPSGIDVSQKGIAFVFLSTTERLGTAEPVVRKYRLTMHYALVPPSTEEELMASPAGLNIPYFEFQEVRP